MICSFLPVPRVDWTVKKTFLPIVLLLLGWCALPASADPKDVVLVLDNSGSMKKNDPEFLTAVAVRKFLYGLSGDNRVAILLFDQDVRLVMPLTPLNDSTRAEFLLGIDQVNYKGLFTDSPAAIERAIYELRVNGRPEANKSIVFMTDGIVDTGNEAMDAEKSSWLRNDLASHAAEQSIRIFAIAFTDNADFLLIQSLSTRTSGEYFRAYTPSDIEGVFRQVIDELGETQTRVIAGGTPALGLPEPAPLPALELPEAPPLSSTLLTEPELAEPAELAEPSMLPEIESPQTLTLPTLPEVGTDDLTSTASEVEDEISATDGEETPASRAEAPVPPDATEFEEEGKQEVTIATSEEAPAAKTALFLPLSALVIAAVVVLFLLATIVALVRRKSVDSAAPADRIPKAFLNDLGGSTEKPSYELCESLTVIGRINGSDADRIGYVVIPEPTIGRRHALIEFRDHCFWVVDQNSINGTFVNNQRIENEARLKHGDRIRFHDHEFEFLMLDMFETDRTMMSQTTFADLSRAVDDDHAQPLASPGSEKTAAS